MKTIKPRLSIVIIAYNEEKYIATCLQSVQDQTLAPDEVIVVDNNSKDRTAEIAKTFPFVKLVTEGIQGIAPARNRGFNEATGDLIVRIDSDTKLPVDWVKKAHEVMDERVKTIAAASGPAYIHDLPVEAGKKLLGDLIIKYGYFKTSKLMLGHEALFGSNMIMTRLAWEKVKSEVCNDSREVHEDMDLGLHISKYGEVLYDERLRAGIAKRGVVEPISKTMWRLRIWPQTVTKHRKLFAKYHPHDQS